jgi:hypothetical protein
MLTKQEWKVGDKIITFEVVPVMISDNFTDYYEPMLTIIDSKKSIVFTGKEALEMRRICEDTKYIFTNENLKDKNL